MDTTRSSRPPRRPRRPLARLAAVAAAAALALPLAACSAGAAPAADPAPPAPPLHQPGGHDLTRDDVDAWLDGVVGAALPQTGIPGATVSVVADGALLTARGYGVADTGTEGGEARPVDPDDTLFRVGSVSKVVSATAVLQLVEQGRVDLDADVQQYVDVPLDLPRGTVTLRHLLTHTAGFEEKIGGLIGEPGDERPLRDVVADQPAQVFEPGTTPAYSNYGAALAGYVVECVTGEPFADVLQREVFDRAGMTSSSFAQPLPADLDARLAKGYPDDSQPAVATEVVNAAPAGAMSATATDMARFVLAHLDELPAEQTLLGPDALDEMHRPALDEDQLGGLADGQRMDLGFFDDSVPGVPAFGHDGDTTVFHTALRIFPESDAGVFVSFNGNGRSATDTLDLRTAVLDGFADRYLRAGDSAAGDAAGDDATGGAGATGASGTADVEGGADAAALEGTYATSRTPVSNPGALLALAGQTTIAARDDGTVAVTPKPLGTTTGVYERTGEHQWREVGGDRLLATRTDDDGRVTGVTWGAVFTLLPASPWQQAGVVLPAVALSVLVLLGSVLAWPTAALARLGRRDDEGRPVRRPRAAGAGGRALLLSRLGQVAVLVALAGWAVQAVQAMSFQDVSAVSLRVLQVLQLLGALAVVPAVVAVVRAVRTHRGWLVVAGRALVVAALVALAWFAVAYRLLGPSVTF